MKRAKAQTTNRQAITKWEQAGVRFMTFIGVMTYFDWCALEVARQQANGIPAKVATRATDGAIAVVRV